MHYGNYWAGESDVHCKFHKIGLINLQYCNMFMNRHEVGLVIGFTCNYNHFTNLHSTDHCTAAHLDFYFFASRCLITAINNGYSSASILLFSLDGSWLTTHYWTNSQWSNNWMVLLHSLGMNCTGNTNSNSSSLGACIFIASDTVYQAVTKQWLSPSVIMSHCSLLQAAQLE
jgi:hypothetical protein